MYLVIIEAFLWKAGVSDAWKRQGFVTLTDHVEFMYKADNYYAPDSEGGILWNDPDIGVDWGVEQPILSEKDKKNPLLRDL